eukprot:g3739.t1
MVRYVVLEGCGNSYAFLRREYCGYGNLRRMAREISKALRTDGIVVVEDAMNKKCDVRMRIFNKDGSEAKMCGNAVRAFPLFLRKSNVLIETRSGMRRVTRMKDTIEVDMGFVQMKRVTTLKNNLRVVLVDVGNPHCVIFLEDNAESLCPTLEDVDVKRIGMRVQGYFKNSTNVSFVKIVSPTEIKQRTFERGSGETLACGTAACACVVAMFETGRIGKDRAKRQRVISHLRGGSLEISWTGYTEDFIMMDGPATEVSRGSMQLSELSFFEHKKFLFSADLSYNRIKLGHLQTPIHAWNLPNTYVDDDDESVSIFIKRDDMTGSGLAGNKIRKLEFLLADALKKGCDCVVTAGAVQSNHCRATAVAASRCNLDSFLILRYDDSKSSTLPPTSFSGNLLLDRLSGAHISLISKTDYKKRGGGNKCVLELCERLRKVGRKPYAIPVGGSNALGTVGYVSMVSQELEQENFDAIFLACGSGGTAAGVALGNYLYREKKKTDVIAFGVCDTPDVFYDEIDRDMYAHLPGVRVCSRDILRIVDAKGFGYGISNEEELEFIASVARTTGVTLDPSYSAKAALAMTKLLRKERGKYKRVLFIHTGGLLGVYKKTCLSSLGHCELGGSWSEF